MRSGDARDNSTGEPFFLSSNADFDGHAALGRIRHFDKRSYFASENGLSVEFKGMRAVGQDNIGSVERLEGEC